MAIETLPQDTKCCSRCKVVKNISTDFYRSPKGRLESWCRECQAIYRADYYEQNRTYIRERRGPYNREYERRRKQTDPAYRQKSIESVRAFWNGLSEEQKKTLNRRKKLLKRYGLTIEQWDALTLEQDGKCAICGSAPSNGKQFHVDHDHDTGKVRGLLCMDCNTSLPWFERISNDINKVVEYIERGKLK